MPQKGFSDPFELMENPSLPVVYVTITREGRKETAQVHPVRMEFVSSIEAADMLKIVLRDPDYYWIDNELLDEDLKTEIHFRFGYGTNLSRMNTLVFYRQRPRFPEADVVTTEIVAYDKGVFLMLPIEPKVMESEEGLTLKQIIQQDIDDVMATYKWVHFDVDFGGFDFEGRWFRHQRATGVASDSDSGEQEYAGTTFQHLRDLAATAVVADGKDQIRPDVYVENNTLHFHPVRNKFKPIARFEYFSVQPGKRLLSFEPDVDFKPGTFKVTEVDVESGQTQGGEGSDATSEQTTTLGENSVSFSGPTGVDTASRTVGERMGEDNTLEVENRTYTVSGNEGANPIQYILEQPQFSASSEDAILVANGWPSADELSLAPGDPVTVPVPVLSAEGRVTRTELAAQAIGQFMGRSNKAITASATVLGNPRLRAGFPIDLFNVGRKWHGRWMIREAQHVIDESGYKTRLKLSRSALMWGENLAAAPGSRNVRPVEPVDADEQEDAAGDAGVGTHGGSGDMRGVDG